MMRTRPHTAGPFRRRRFEAALALICAPTPSGAQARPDACEESLADLFERVSPAVVSIGATSINPYRVSERVSPVVGSGVRVDAGG